MSDLTERINRPISTAELERRWRAVRAAMHEQEIDALVLQNNSESLGGYVRWLTDLPASAYPTTVVFGGDEGMTVVMHGSMGSDRTLASQEDGLLRGVTRVLGTASFPSVEYTRHYDADLAADALAPYAAGTIGLVGTYQMSLAAGERLRQSHPTASFVEASGLIDAIKAIKSEEEQELIRATAGIQDQVMAAALEAVAPGRRESDVTAVARRVAHELGSEAGIFMTGAGPVGSPAVIAPRHLQARRIRRGDVLAILVEIDGPGGLYAELGRTCVVGPAPAQLLEEFAFALAAQRFTIDRFVPGASCRDIWHDYNAFMREGGRPEEQRLHAHGQGYDLVERQLVRFDEDMTIQVGMNMTCHPGYVRSGVFSWVCDNWLIGDLGPGQRLHSFPQEIIEL
jgi:Xaa-Pro aminopeptidase